MLRPADVIILCGGIGRRLKSITGDTPKAMAIINGQPFLELLLKQLSRHGFQRVILAVGYQKNAIRSHFGQRALDMWLEYSEEADPLGTGGALRKAVTLAESGDVMIMNGDSYTDAHLSSFALSHSRTGADVSVLVVPADGRSDCGLVSVGESGAVIRFREKQHLYGPRYINAGIYMAGLSILRAVPDGLKLSLEEDIFPQWLANGANIRAFVAPVRCVDIGTPERYLSAQDILARAETQAVCPRFGRQ